MPSKHIYKTCIFFLFAITGFAQTSILDDSTKQIYGLSSTGFLFEKNFLQNDTTLLHPDSLLGNFRLTDIVRKNEWLWQDLGNEATASKPYYPTTPSSIATQNGFNAFSLYAPNADSIKYYNTRSPYTNLFYNQNSRGLLKAGFTHSQNINPLLNFTLDVNRITSSKQFSATTSEDRLVDHWDYTFSSNYTSANRKYSLLASWIHFNHKQNEQGGLTVEDGFNVPLAILSSDYNNFYSERLTGVESRERWNDLHVYQQFRASNGFQVYNTFDYKRHKNFYNDLGYASNYDPLIYSDTTSLDSLKTYYNLNIIQSEIGLKGKMKGFNYIAGFQPRILTNQSEGFTSSKINITELIGKLKLNYDFPDSTSYLIANAMLGAAVGEAAQSNLNYLIDADAVYKGVHIGFYNSLSPVPLLFQSYDSDLLSWKNNFNAPIFTSLDFRLPLKFKRIAFESGIQLSRIDNFLYFDNSQQPQQSVDSKELLNVELGVTFENNWLKVQHKAMFNTNDDNAVLSIPQWVNNSNIEFRIVYAKILKLHFGFNFYHRSAYKAMAYSPLLQSFYTQNTSTVWGQPIIDTYATFLVKKVKVGLAFDYLNQGFPANGFYTTPGYLGLRRAFHIKVNWPLFD